MKEQAQINLAFSKQISFLNREGPAFQQKLAEEGKLSPNSQLMKNLKRKLREKRLSGGQLDMAASTIRSNSVVRSTITSEISNKNMVMRSSAY